MENVPILVAWAETADVVIWILGGILTMGLAGWLTLKGKEKDGSEVIGSILILIGFGFLCWAILAELPEAVKALAWAYS